MELITCEKGHKYDPALTSTCPECAMELGWMDQDTVQTPDISDLFDIQPPGWVNCPRHGIYHFDPNGCPDCRKEREAARGRVNRLWRIVCPNGHRYDPTLTDYCPECRLFGLDGEEQGETLQSETDRGQEISIREENLFDGPTIQLPLPVGWLVCIQGPAHGASWKLHSDNNFIGRDPENDVALLRDTTVSKVKHCVITYDGIERKFYVGLSAGASIIRLNGRPVLMTQEMKRGDQLRIGQGTYMLLPLCGEDFCWEDWPPPKKNQL